MSSERRVVRPYRGLARFQSLLDGWSARIGPVSGSSGATLVVSAASMRSDPLVLSPGPDAESCARDLLAAREAAGTLGLTARDVEIVIVASNPYLRIGDVVHRARLDDEGALPSEIILKSETVRALQTPAGGCDVAAYFCLAEEMDPAPLRPHRRGTWLGKVEFSLRTELGELGFTPRTLTNAKRTELGLRADAIRYVEVEVDGLLGERLDDAVELYVDEDLLGHLNRSADSAAVRSFQRQLFVDVMSAVVRVVARWDGVDTLQVADLQGTVLGRIVDAVAGTSGGDSPDLLQARRELVLETLRKRPEVFVANVEALARPKDDLRSTIGGFE